MKKKIIIIAVAAVVVAAVAAGIIFYIPAYKIGKRYDEAVALLNEKPYEAAAELRELGDYKDSAEKLRAVYSSVLSSAGIGDTVSFGKYEQDGNIDNGSEPLKWCVIAKEDGKALLLTEDIIDTVAYNNTKSAVSWETSSVRKWLGNDFMPSVFDETEKSFIASVTLNNPINPEYRHKRQAKPGDTEDSVFFLSFKEYKKYSDAVPLAKVTEAAKKNGTYIKEGTENGIWWLRTTGYDDQSAMFVEADKTVCYAGSINSFEGRGLRPAVWVNIE